LKPIGERISDLLGEHQAANKLTINLNTCAGACCSGGQPRLAKQCGQYRVAFDFNPNTAQGRFTLGSPFQLDKRMHTQLS
jgi:hypothetical protein